MNMQVGARAERAAIYSRLSESRDGDDTNVVEQEKHARKLAADSAHGWTISEKHVYTDNNRTAAKPCFNPDDPTKPRRPAFAAMLEAAERGEFDHIIVRHLDRLYRHPADLQALVAAIGKHKVTIYQSSNDKHPLDLSVASNFLTASIMADVALYELNRKGERQRDENDRKRREGIAHGGIAGYGYRLVEQGKEWQLEQVPEEAERLKKTILRFLDGAKLYTLQKEWNNDGIKTRRGNPWGASSFRATLTKASNAACREGADGGLVEGGKWEPIVSPDQLKAVRQKIEQQSKDRHANHTGTATKHLLTGIAKCAACGGTPMRVSRNRHGDFLQCPGVVNSCRKSVDMHVAEMKVEDEIRARLMYPSPALLEATKDDREAATAMRVELADLKDSGKKITEAKASGAIGLDDALALLQDNKTKRDALEDDLGHLERRMAVAGLIGELIPDEGFLDKHVRVQNAWADLDLHQQREVIRALVTMTVNPSEPGVRASKHTADKRIVIADGPLLASV